MEFGQGPDWRQRTVNVGLVAALHLLILYALVVGLAHKMISVLPPPIETKILEEVKPPDEPPPPPPPPTFSPPPTDFVPLPEINIATPPPQHAITAVTNEPVVHSPPAPVRSDVRVPPVIDAKRACPEPEYPSMSLRLGEKGTVSLQFLIDVDGSVKDSRVVTSSGHPRLDEAARRALSRCRFTAGTLNGVKEQSWAAMKYTWRIPN